MNILWRSLCHGILLKHCGRSIQDDFGMTKFDIWFNFFGTASLYLITINWIEFILYYLLALKVFIVKYYAMYWCHPQSKSVLEMRCNSRNNQAVKWPFCPSSSARSELFSPLGGGKTTIPSWLELWTLVSQWRLNRKTTDRCGSCVGPQFQAAPTC